MLRLLACCLLLALPARAADPDPWFSKDKGKHFAASWVLATNGYLTGVIFSEEPWVRLAVGGTLSMGLGIGKEVWDAAGYGDPSWKDLGANTAGALTGMLTSYAIDRLFHYVVYGASSEPTRE